MRLGVWLSWSRDAVSYWKSLLPQAALRREVHNKLVDALGSIRVLARVRPVLKHEVESGEARDITSFPEEDVIAIDLVRNSRVEREAGGRYEFDRVLNKASSQVRCVHVV